ncbi:MAG: flippase-like domain-containing protein [Planctomycetaceae bacterium]|nr:flippase-like domain-containing protein [Planctomycetaceae bacterium]
MALNSGLHNSSEDSVIHRNKWFQLAIGLAVTGLCLWIAVREVDLAEIQRQFSHARYETIPLYLLCLIAFFVLKAVRWAWLLSPVCKVSSREVAGPMMIGFMGNNVLPAHLGEVFRVVLLSRQEKVSLGGVFSSVAIERVLDVIAVLILVGCGLLSVRNLPEVIEKGFLAGGVVVLLGVIVLAAGVIFLDHSVKLALWLVNRFPLPDRWKEQLSHLIESGAQAAGVLRNVRLVGLLLANSVIQWGLNCLMIAISLWSFGIEVPLAATFILLGVLVFAVTIPSSPGFVGAIQAGFVITLKMFDVPDASALAASIYYHVIQYVVVTGVGFIFLARTGISLSRLQSDAEHLEEGEPERLIDPTPSNT